MNRSQITQKVIDNGAVAVVRLKDPDKFLKVAEALREGGLFSIEITLTVPNAFQLIERTVKEFGDNLFVGVGSVLNAESAQKAIDAGANYVVSPVFKKEIIETAHKSDIPAMPGCFTPTEMQIAHEAGADIIKVFPADVVGMAFFKAVKAPMPHLKMMPTGGVTLTNAGDWIKAGACAVGVGSALLDPKAIDAGDYARLTENAKILMSSVNSAK